MDIYQNFTRQTDHVVHYLGVARQHEHQTRVEVPKLKHAPVNLGRQLEDYLRDPDFEVHRRQYLAEIEAKKSGDGTSKLFKSSAETKASSSKPGITATAVTNKNGFKAAAKPQATKGPDPDLIDFFGSIEQNQTPMAVQPPAAQLQTGMTPWGPAAAFQNGFVAQPTGFQATNPFQQQQQQLQQQQAMAPPPMQPAFTGAGFGGYAPQQAFQPGSLAPIPQDSVAAFPSALSMSMTGLQNGQQQTNPFRQSMMMASPTGMQPGGMPLSALPMSATPVSPGGMLVPQSTNPFARSATQPVAGIPPSSMAPLTFQSQLPAHSSTGPPCSPWPPGRTRLPRTSPAPWPKGRPPAAAWCRSRRGAPTPSARAPLSTTRPAWAGSRTSSLSAADWTI